MNVDTLADLVYLTECADAAYNERIPHRLPFESHIFLHDDQKHYHRGFVAQGEGFIVTAIKGTKSFEDFIKDATFEKVPFLGHKPWMVHKGFNEEFNAVWPDVEKKVRAGKGKVFVAGHSMGAAVGALIAFALKEVHNINTDRAVLPGCPRVGNRAFAKAYNERVPMTWRIVDDMDLVPRWPHLGYWHFDHLFHLAHDGHELHPSKSILKNIWNTLRVLVSDITGESLRDHSADRYVKLVQSVGWGGNASYPDTHGK